MPRIYFSVTELVGRTPLVRLNRLATEAGAEAEILLKIESKNPGGSVKDRPILNMVEAAEREGKLAPGATLIEPTSGNTGVALAWVGAVRGYRVVIVMPETMSVERRALIKAFGAQLVLTPGSEGMAGTLKKANELLAATPGSLILQQFSNPHNPEAHALTAQEIWEDTDEQVDAFVAGVGTGGTVSGVGRVLKVKNPNVKIIAVEPAESSLLTQGKAGGHVIQGIGANFVPDNFDRQVVDEILPVPGAEALTTARLLASREGILCGISSGAAAWAALQLARRTEFKGKRIVALLPDTGERYLSTALFAQDK